ncbi:MAG: 1-deoxy-D-xylulose-5-phosphate reductoisomerase, partial [Pseudomonadota bacterium]
IMNAANEVAVARFLEGGMAFPKIFQTVENTLEAADAQGLCGGVNTLDDILRIDAEGRRLAKDALTALI